MKNVLCHKCTRTGVEPKQKRPSDVSENLSLVAEPGEISNQFLKSKIDLLGVRKDWDDAFFRRVKIDFTYNSNKLEGNTLTYGQAIKLLHDFVAPKNAASRELLDMINHQKITIRFNGLTMAYIALVNTNPLRI